ncbi:hypothetical protein AMTR_s00019p00234780 [Amborella trichopoda]|uniref:IBH1-like N-terminal domain-containing protein n=2 Tax=Amborella trichopoda TaxID=13333 RepID=W1PI16_AMBTC|nr:hypothetical protein AMTR_s00019p00234780 [Amborella trichopoda]
MEQLQIGKRKRVCVSSENMRFFVTFARNYVSYLLPALIKIGSIADPDLEVEKLVRFQVDMALVLSAGSGFTWCKAMKCKLEKETHGIINMFMKQTPNSTSPPCENSIKFSTFSPFSRTFHHVGLLRNPNPNFLSLSYPSPQPKSLVENLSENPKPKSLMLLNPNRHPKSLVVLLENPNSDSPFMAKPNHGHKSLVSFGLLSNPSPDSHIISNPNHDPISLVDAGLEKPRTKFLTINPDPKSRVYRAHRKKCGRRRTRNMGYSMRRRIGLGKLRGEEKEIRKRLRILREVTPGGNEMRVEALFGEVESYMHCLELQVQILQSLVSHGAKSNGKL